MVDNCTATYFPLFNLDRNSFASSYSFMNYSCESFLKPFSAVWQPMATSFLSRRAFCRSLACCFCLSRAACNSYALLLVLLYSAWRSWTFDFSASKNCWIFVYLMWYDVSSLASLPDNSSVRFWRFCSSVSISLMYFCSAAWTWDSIYFSAWVLISFSCALSSPIAAFNSLTVFLPFLIDNSSF